MDYGKKAKDLFLEGANCAQATLCAFCDKTGMSEEDAMKIASSFGGGMGRLREVCGACSGIFMAAGILYGYSDKKAVEEKKEHYELIQKLAAEFKEKNGSIICRELLDGVCSDSSPNPEKRTEQYYHKRPCAEYVEDAARILEKYIKEN